MLLDDVSDGARQANLAVDQHRICKLGCGGIDDGTQIGHSGTTGEVARPLPVSTSQPRRLAGLRAEAAAAGPDMAGKASEPIRATW